MIESISKGASAAFIGLGLCACSGTGSDAGTSNRAEQSTSTTGDSSSSGSSGSLNDESTSGGSSLTAEAAGGDSGEGMNADPEPTDDALGANPPDPNSIDCRADGDGSTTIAFVNGCNQPVEYRGSDIAGGTVPAGSYACVTIGSASETLNSKRFWGYVGDDPGAGRYTLAEFTFNTDFNDFDWYNISHVDAHNLPMQIVPVERSECEVLTCEESWLASCPEAGQYKDGEGAVVSCVSPDRDDPESEVVLFFEGCDEAYAWSLDEHYGGDVSPMRACAAEDFDVVFCPTAE